MHKGACYPDLLTAAVQKQPVCALVMRAFGECLAEVPLIATKPASRRKGFAKVLLDALSELLARVIFYTLLSLTNPIKHVCNS